MRQPSVTQAELKSLVNYNPDTGHFTWKFDRNWRAKAGDIAGHVNAITGYVELVINKKLYLCHRLAFLFMTGKWPKKETDHINNIRSDNRWCNLREAEISENRCNTRISKNNSSGFKGVYFDARQSTWYGQVRKNGKCHSTNGHSTADEANEAVKIIRQTLHGEFTNHGGSI